MEQPPNQNGSMLAITFSTFRPHQEESVQEFAKVAKKIFGEGKVIVTHNKKEKPERQPSDSL